MLLVVSLLYEVYKRLSPQELLKERLIVFEILDVLLEVKDVIGRTALELESVVILVLGIA